MLLFHAVHMLSRKKYEPKTRTGPLWSGGKGAGAILGDLCSRLGVVEKQVSVRTVQYNEKENRSIQYSLNILKQGSPLLPHQRGLRHCPSESAARN